MVKYFVGQNWFQVICDHNPRSNGPLTVSLIIKYSFFFLTPSLIINTFVEFCISSWDGWNVELWWHILDCCLHFGIFSQPTHPPPICLFDSNLLCLIISWVHVLLNVESEFENIQNQCSFRQILMNMCCFLSSFVP